MIRPAIQPSTRSFSCYICSNEGRGLTHGDLAKPWVQPITSAGAGAIASVNVAAAVKTCQYELNGPS
jgi:TrmH family RNA methyltransferase